jgi:signal transduction histidine kinase
MPFQHARQVMRRSAVLLLGVGLVILLGVGTASLVLVRQTRSFADASGDWQAARVLALTALEHLQDAETGQRGFLLTGDEAYLQPYDAAVAALPGTLDKLYALLQRLPDGAADRARLGSAVADKLAELAETIALQRQGRPGDALALVRTDRGKQAMDAARAAEDHILAEVEAHRTVDRAGLYSRSAILLNASWIGLALIIAVAAAAAWLVVRMLHELEEAQRDVVATNASLEQRVQERTAALAAANEEVQRFAYIVSHDLRAPLVNVMGFTAELEAALGTVRTLLASARAEAPGLVSEEARLAVEEDLPEALGFIRSSTQRMDRLSNAILRLSREGRRTLAPERLRMQELLEAIAASVQHQLDQADATVTVQAPMPDIVSDRLALEQVFGNLVDNAVKYLARGRPGRVVVRGAAHGRMLRFEVEDNGRGIEPKDRERVFELVRRAGAQDRPGEGIGLAHVRALVRRLGGTIDFRSEPGQGTTFVVELPRSLGPTAEGIAA